MSTSRAWSVARLIRNDAIAKQIQSRADRYSPHNLLSQFNQSSTLTVKRALRRHRFFMYEEHGPVKLKDDRVAHTINVSPNELADYLGSSPQSLFNKNQNIIDSNSEEMMDEFHYYWTSPIASVSPPISPTLSNDLQYINQQLHNNYTDEHPLLDPRGPSLWMGTSGSGTQCHYDVANNIIVQLHGTKRIRCYPPTVGVYNLHVFPDAHPRARKSQVNFDTYYNSNNKNSKHDGVDDQRQRFPHFVNLPQPTLDVILQPGDVIEIPAFWFHHVENGYVGSEGYSSYPSVSLNSFVLSRSMMIAQNIFQKASRPLQQGQVKQNHHDMSEVDVPSVLYALGTALIRGLKIVNDGKEADFIRQYLLHARYDPLQPMEQYDNMTEANDYHHNVHIKQQPLAKEQIHAINACIENILPYFQHLIEEEDADCDVQTNDRNGIALLVGLHLLELWAVEFVGAKSVANVWNRALSL